MTTEPKEPASLSISQIMLEKAEFAHRDDYLATPPGPGVDPGGAVQMAVQVQIDPEQPLVILRLNINNNEADAPLYRFDVVLTGVLATSRHLEASEARPLAITGGAILFPFAREAIANMTGRGRFGPLWLQPMNVAKALAAGETEVIAPGAGETTPPERKRPVRKRPA